MNWESPTLYKKMNNGKIMSWKIYVNGDTYTAEFGYVDGIKQRYPTTIYEGKNIGKSNETTPEMQALLEAKSLFNKQVDRKGYLENLLTVTNSKIKALRPMLAQKFSEHSHKIVFPALIQPKLDGIRTLAIETMKGNIEFLSRQNKEFKTLSHLASDVKRLYDEIYHEYPDSFIESFDGELYNHEFKDNFQKLVSLIKRDKALPDTSLIQYHIYDVVCDDTFADRNQMLKQAIANLQLKNIIYVPTYVVNSSKEIDKKHAEFLADGYEGSMIRNAASFYEVDKRSYNLQKKKDFDDEEFNIVDAVENTGKQEGECTIICQTPDGKRFGVKPKGNTYVRQQYWDDFNNGDLVGKKMIVRFFGYSNDGIPRFPIGIGLRNYE